MGRFSRLEREGGGGDPSGASQEAPQPGAPGPAAPTTRPDEEELYPSFILQADECFFTGQYRDALRHYSRALQQVNNQVYPWIGQISALLELKQYKEAELWSNRALEQFPEDPSLLAQRARVLAATGNIKRGIGVSDYALAKGATAWTWLGRGEVLLQARDGNALFAFHKAMELAGPQDWRIPLLSGLAFVRHRRNGDAEEFLKLAVQRNSQNYFIWYEYAKVLLALNYTERAQDAIKRVQSLKPGFREGKKLEESLYRQPLHKRLLGMFRRR